MGSDNTEFRLYVAGRAPNSQLAIANLNEICRKYLPGRHQLEIVDVLQEPQRALDDGVFLTPLLMIRSLTPVQRIVGNLSRAEVLLSALGIAQS